ncbi:hypothetical protein Pan110_39670 [Gimesia panareensis]|nr:hypothetical protein Pan110_39670 [Gimesia panareensis]
MGVDPETAPGRTGSYRNIAHPLRVQRLTFFFWEFLPCFSPDHCHPL